MSKTKLEFQNPAVTGLSSIEGVGWRTTHEEYLRFIITSVSG
jgi:hypothetical protein